MCDENNEEGKKSSVVVSIILGLVFGIVHFECKEDDDNSCTKDDSS